MKFQIIAIAATAVSTTLGAAVQQRDGTCRLRVGFARGQHQHKNPIAGGENSLACISELTYADGNKEQLSDECRYVMNDHCYPSGLPYSLWQVFEMQPETRRK
ncbi:hypothetical protein BM221_001448 [Beauveria bassiana]|uniref:Uncharacterized protein n=1 Tax=Beauveria bassiana TaxID=176275 RepID=A0A2N6NVR7_BEABA|nr:hypothetical protein BM221_001448 [Beauveria bassiana]